MRDRTPASLSPELFIGTGSLQLNHGNAGAHLAATTLDYLEENLVQLVAHSLYYPDLPS